MEYDLICDLRSRVARLAVGASTVRGKGNKGAGEAARKYFLCIDLHEMASCSVATYPLFLDRHTDWMLAKLPEGASRWGLARKLINIYLRDVVYSRHLCDHFRGIAELESLLELPLDSLTGRGLIDLGASVPPWRGVKALRHEESALYQSAASNIALAHGIARVHLDAALWGNRDAHALKTNELHGNR
ncbi:MAG: hypothetical protein ACK5RX_07400 [bacterium]